ncbi:MAG: SPOR domain-containing protein [Chlorobi bacterium]|nr:SPOR domain-containing protein [Chlorobiota bacterium]
MMKKVLAFCLALLASYILLAQQSFTEKEGESKNLPEIIERLNIKQDPRLTNMLKWHIENNLKKNGTDGFRVEIFTSSDSDALEKSLQVKKEFLVMYPETDVHIKYNAPDFKVRVGDFRTRNEALRLQKHLDGKFPNSFIVEDIIRFPKLYGERIK